MTGVQRSAAMAAILCCTLFGCATSRDEQRSALAHQEKADDAAQRGAYSVAADEQKRAAEAHHDAVVKAMKEGSPIPPQPKVGDKPPNP
jgi:hypothetical protein